MWRCQVRKHHPNLFLSELKLSLKVLYLSHHHPKGIHAWIHFCCSARALWVWALGTQGISSQMSPSAAVEVSSSSGVCAPSLTNYVTHTMSTLYIELWLRAPQAVFIIWYVPALCLLVGMLTCSVAVYLVHMQACHTASYSLWYFTVRYRLMC